MDASASDRSGLRAQAAQCDSTLLQRTAGAATFPETNRMSTTTIQTVATTQLDPRDVATIHAALLCYQAQRVTPALLHDEVHDAATGNGQHLPLSHQETFELLDLIRAGDVLELHTLGNDWQETGSDVHQALEVHASARTERTGDTVGILLRPDPAAVRASIDAMNG
jgi:hypothetical protein